MKISQDWKDAFVHLRLHFSLLLMPVFLFSISETNIFLPAAVLVFIILHILVYPASNLYNSFHDNDESSIGGIKNPPPTNSRMLLLANLLDGTAILLSMFLGTIFSCLVLTYIVFSRLYSHSSTRLKRYPILGFATIFLLQGAFTYMLVSYGSSDEHTTCFYVGKSFDLNKHLYALLATSFQIGAIYPLTQIYQHESDRSDGVTTLSYKMGYRGTFVFSAVFFTIATVFYFLHFKENDIESFYLLMFAQTPIVSYFLFWAIKVWKDPKNADYKHTMTMNTLAAICLNLLFIYLIIK